MDSQSRLKVVNAGFIIIRTDDSPNIRIKYMGKFVQNWSTYNTYNTKVERDSAFKELLKKEKFITD